MNTSFKHATIFSILAAMLFLCQPALVTAATPLFHDDFDGPGLDLAKWTVLNGELAIEVTGGLLVTQGESNRQRIDSFESFQPMGDTLVASALIEVNGDLQKFGFRVNPVTQTGPVNGFYFDTLDTAENEDTITAKVREVSAAGEVTRALTVTMDAAWGEFHVLTVEWSPTEVAFYIDGEEKARTAGAYTEPLPISIWNNGPGTMRTDWVQLTSVPTVTSVSVDIKPGSDVNPVNPRSRGVTPVALLTTDNFNAMSVDPETVEFGANDVYTGPAHYAVEDINGDGMADYIFHFWTQLTGIDCDTESATLTGEATAGVISGSDTIRPVGCRAPGEGGTGGAGPPAHVNPPAFDNHPVHDSKPGKGNHPEPNAPGQNKVKSKNKNK